MCVYSFTQVISSWFMDRKAKRVWWYVCMEEVTMW